MVNNNNPAQRSSAGGAGRHTSDVGAALPPKQQPGNDAIWDACREARGPVDTTLWFNAQQLRTAQAQLNFVQDKRGRWWLQQCPHCGGWVKLCAYSSGSIRASSYGDAPYCAAVNSINRWLRDEGFQSGDAS